MGTLLSSPQGDIFTESRHPEEPLQTKDQGERILHTRKVPVLNDRGEAEYLLGISEDVTESKRAEKERERLQLQLNHAQKMESVGRLAGGLAHDFNNMLSVILGNAELALRQVDPSHELVAYLREIQSTAERSAEMTRRLLAFARKQIIAARVLDLNQVVAGMLNMLQRLIGENVRLAWRPGEKLWPVKADPSQVDQILANLCVNARDAIAGTGNIVISTRNVACDAAFCAHHGDAAPGNYVVLSVGDDGCGMDAVVRERLFEPFFTTKEPGRGTGLGLATVYGIVRQNQGFIHVESEPGRGSTFNIYLPRRSDAAPAQPARALSSACARGHETVLVVEDEPAILRIIVAMLRNFGYDTLSAANPEEALRLAGDRAGPIHLLITDMIMPGMSGRDLVDRLGAKRPDLKCLFMSGHAHHAIADQGLDTGGTPFIQKPFTMQDFAAKVRDVLDAG